MTRIVLTSNTYMTYLKLCVHAAEHTEAALLAYDRPSPKLEPFLQKHYSLTNGMHQSNRFMVFQQYFAALSNSNSSSSNNGSSQR
jgi:GNAT acetyltransferase, Mec-17